MGCDIHMYVEVRAPDGTWKSADRWVEEEGRKDITYPHDFEPGRNYDLFSILADVRNGRGFAGVKTGNGFVPISEPRGLPDDVSADVQQAADDWGEDGHSHSYLTVAELLAYDWTQTTEKTGMVDLQGLAQWKLSGAPRSYSGGVWGGEVRHFTAEAGVLAVEQAIEEVNSSIAAGERNVNWWDIYHTRNDALKGAVVDKLGGGSPYFKVEWAVSYFERATEFLSETMPKLWRLGHPDDVRIVFFFDN